MSLITVNNRREMIPSFPFFDDLFDDVALGTKVPAVNVTEEDHSFEIEIAAPGLKKDDFKVSAHNNVLTISAETSEEKNEKGKVRTRR